MTTNLEQKAKQAVDSDDGQDASGIGELHSLSCCGSAKFFCRHSYKDVGRRKCNFCLAFCSVFIVVLATLVINTVVTFGPIIFLKVGEAKVGQFDAVMVPKKVNFNSWDSFQNV